jgi:hypothetical protein
MNMREIAISFAAFCIAWCAIEAALVLRQARTQMIVLPALVDYRIKAEAAEIRKLMANEISAARRLIDRNARAATSQLASESQAWREQTAQAIENNVTAAFIRLDRIEAQAASVAATANAAIDEYRRIPAAVGQRLDSWTDCAGNGACWQAQATALLGASRVTAGETSRTMRAIREATPQIVANVDATTSNVARLTKPDSMRWRILKIAAPIATGAIFGAIK